jgi:rubrerythrin
MFTRKDLFDIAVQIEQNGEDTYRAALRRKPNPEMADLLQWMADEEASHGEWFEKQRSDATGPVSNSEIEQMGRFMLTAALGKGSFSLTTADLSRADHAGQLIRKAIEFENETLLFYEMLRSMVADPDGLESIIAEEMRHVEKLTVLLEDLIPQEELI